MLAGLGGVALEQPGEEADGGQPQWSRRGETVLEEAEEHLVTITIALEFNHYHKADTKVDSHGVTVSYPKFHFSSQNIRCMNSQ